MERSVKKYFTEKAFSFDEIYSGSRNPFTEFLNKTLRWDIWARMSMALQRLSRADVRSILDIGCGTGRLTIELSRAGKEAVGIDFSPKMIAIANAIKARLGIANAAFICADFAEYIMKRQFDACVALGFFDHAREPLSYLAKISGCTGRTLVATFPRSGTLRAFLRSVRLRMFGLPVFFYDDEKIRHLMAAAGFQVRELAVVGQLYYVEAQKR